MRSPVNSPCSLRSPTLALTLFRSCSPNGVWGGEGRDWGEGDAFSDTTKMAADMTRKWRSVTSLAEMTLPSE